MTTYSKPTVRNSWGQTASGTDLVDPGNTFASAGWQIGVKPPRQYMNWVLNYTFAGIRYLCQQGIAAWDPAETYSVHNYTVASNGVLAQSLLNNNTNQEPNATFGTAWDSPYVGTPGANDNSARVANTAWVHGYALPIGTAVGSLSGQVTNPQVPVGAVTQWQGSLSIGGSQITSAVARANTILLNGASYATFGWSGQSGQPTWLFGSNDGANVFVWNPANFSVNNSALLAGFSPSSGAGGNTVGIRDSGGNFYAGYYNSAAGNGENPSISQFMVTNGGDGFLRKASVSAVQAALGSLTTANFPALLSANGYQKLPTGVILQWGSAAISGTTAVTFPVTFPNGVSHVTLTNISSTNQLFITSLAASSFTVSNGSNVVSWLAMGY